MLYRKITMLRVHYSKLYKNIRSSKMYQSEIFPIVSIYKYFHYSAQPVSISPSVCLNWFWPANRFKWKDSMYSCVLLLPLSHHWFGWATSEEMKPIISCTKTILSLPILDWDSLRWWFFFYPWSLSYWMIHRAYYQCY